MVEQDGACHRGKGPAGYYGAETSDCDSPISLVNASIEWVAKNHPDIDFIIWTGDSARHDNDENIPRTKDQIIDLNNLCVNKFLEVFGSKDKHGNPSYEQLLPIVPTWGNNDILPHNIFTQGPNIWTKEFLDIWKRFIPESQRHSFEFGGWFFVEVIPDKLAVFSLNSLYFFDNNNAVEGCADPNEPGYGQFEWLRVQLQFIRERGMKAIMIGHVPPARTDSKMSWDETCWQKYTLWMRQYRDVVVSSMWGHMNIDHFMFQDSEEVDIKRIERTADSREPRFRIPLHGKIGVKVSTSYLTDLRDAWSKLPKRPKALDAGVSGGDSEDGTTLAKKNRDHERKYFEEVGGPFGERYSLSLVTGSIVPNYFPSMRIIEYNVSGLDSMVYSSHGEDFSETEVTASEEDSHSQLDLDENHEDGVEASSKKKNKHKKKKKRRKHTFKMPKGPSSTSPPGPAYSPQALSLLGYSQFLANLTVINNDFHDKATTDDGVEAEKWRTGKHADKTPKGNSKPHPKEFKFELEYNTRNDSVYKLRDLTMMSYLRIAHRIGKFKPERGDHRDEDWEEVELGRNELLATDEGDLDSSSEVDIEKKRKKHKKHKNKKKKKHGKSKVINRPWFTFVRRAFIDSWDEKDLHEEFGQPVNDLRPAQVSASDDREASGGDSLDNRQEVLGDLEL